MKYDRLDILGIANSVVLSEARSLHFASKIVVRYVSSQYLDRVEIEIIAAHRRCRSSFGLHHISNCARCSTIQTMLGSFSHYSLRSFSWYVTHTFYVLWPWPSSRNPCPRGGNLWLYVWFVSLHHRCIDLQCLNWFVTVSVLFSRKEALRANARVIFLRTLLELNVLCQRRSM